MLRSYRLTWGGVSIIPYHGTFSERSENREDHDHDVMLFFGFLGSHTDARHEGAVDRASNAEDGIANEIQKFIVDLCEQLECRRLRDVHHMVHYQQLCCVHGDYNISNFLFPANENDQRKPVLIDWATAGYGNPMIDLAFFLSSMMA